MAKSRFYSKHLGPKLSDAVNDILSAPVSDQYGALEELTIVRALNGDAVALYETAQQSTNGDLKLSAARMLAESCENVVRTAERAVNVAAKSREMYPIETLQTVVDQMVRIIHDCLEPYKGTELTEDIINYLGEALLHDLRLPGDTSRGTTLDVTRDVELMDASIVGQ